MRSAKPEKSTVYLPPEMKRRVKKVMDLQRRKSESETINLILEAAFGFPGPIKLEDLSAVK